MKKIARLIILFVILLNISFVKADIDYDKYRTERVELIKEGKKLVESKHKSYSDCIDSFISKSVKKGSATHIETIKGQEFCVLYLEARGDFIWTEEYPSVLAYITNELYTKGLKYSLFLRAAPRSSFSSELGEDITPVIRNIFYIHSPKTQHESYYGVFSDINIAGAAKERLKGKYPKNLYIENAKIVKLSLEQFLAMLKRGSKLQ